MWLQTPDTIDEILWEGSLEPATDEDAERLTRELTKDPRSRPQNYIRALPLVSIGKPEVWALSEIFPFEKMPLLLRAQLEKADFYLARFPISFRPVHKESQVEWARFIVHLLPDADAQQAIAFDLHPLLVSQQIKHNIKVSLGPSLKFQEIEGNVGSIGFGFEYAELQPVISASGAGEAEPSWDYEQAKGVFVQGSKWMHMLIKAPGGMMTIRAILDLAAEVRVQQTRLPVLAIRNKKQAYEHFSVRLI